MAWYSRIDAQFIEIGFKQSPNEPTVYCKHQGDNDALFLCLYIDDIIYMPSSDLMLWEFKEIMLKTFEMIDLGSMKYFLAMEVM